jgi:hypothetical protein
VRLPLHRRRVGFPHRRAAPVRPRDRLRAVTRPFASLDRPSLQRTWSRPAAPPRRGDSARGSPCDGPKRLRFTSLRPPPAAAAPTPGDRLRRAIVPGTLPGCRDAGCRSGEEAPREESGEDRERAPGCGNVAAPDSECAARTEGAAEGGPRAASSQARNRRSPRVTGNGKLGGR